MWLSPSASVCRRLLGGTPFPALDMSDVTKFEKISTWLEQLISETFEESGLSTTEKEKNDFLDVIRQNKKKAPQVTSLLAQHSLTKPIRARTVKREFLAGWLRDFRTSQVKHEKQEEDGFTRVGKIGKASAERTKGSSTTAKGSYADAAKGTKGKGLAAAVGTSKQLRGPDSNWSLYLPTSANLLIDQTTGKPAEKLDPEDPVKLATGFSFVSKQSLETILAKYSEAIRPVAFIIETEEKSAEELKKNIETEVKRFREKADLSGGAFSPTIESTKLMLSNSKSKAEIQGARSVLIVNMDSNGLILPAHHKKISAFVKTNTVHCMPDISFSRPEFTSIAVSVVKPICEEIGMETWWQKLSKMDTRALQKELTKTISMKDWSPHLPFIPRSRALKWRGEDIEIGRIRAIFRVPDSKAEDVLSQSGRHGLIIEVDKRAGQGKEDLDELIKVKLPQETTMSDVIKKIDALPAQVKKATRGVIPTYKGYAIRCRREAELDVTKHLNPDEAETLGPAMGLKMETAWVVRGVPGYATRAQIISNLAKSSGNGWPGWTVRPRKTLSSTARQGGTATWLIDAVTEPPLRVITLNKAVITIEMYYERSTTKSKATAFSIRKPKNSFDMDPGQLYEDEEDSEDERMQQDPPKSPRRDHEQKPESYAMDVDQQQSKADNRNSQILNDPQPPRGERRTSSERSTPTTMAEGEPATKRKHQDSNGEPTNTMESMFEFMKTEANKRKEDADNQKTELAKKDQVIQSLNETIASLQAEMAELRKMLKDQLEGKGC